eukprot:jgi/Tetstr1/433186/TSEL_002369.t1
MSAPCLDRTPYPADSIKAFLDELGQRTLDLIFSSALTASQTLKSYAGKLIQVAEFCHDSKNTIPLEATTATVVCRAVGENWSNDSPRAAAMGVAAPAAAGYHHQGQGARERLRRGDVYS